MSLRVRADSGTLTSIRLRVDTTAAPPRITHVKIRDRGGAALGLEPLYALLWVQAAKDVQPADAWTDPAASNRAEERAVALLADLAAFDPGVRPDIITVADAKRVLAGKLTIDPGDAQVRALVERVIASSRTVTPAVSDNPKYTHFFAGAAAADGWWAPVEWEAQSSGVTFVRDERASDARRISAVADAQAVVDAYTGREHRTAWPKLDTMIAAVQIRARCRDHRLFQQGGLNLCGPAAFFHIWAGRDPVGYARYAIAMLEEGKATLGSTTVVATADLRAVEASALIQPLKAPTPHADFLCMAPLRDKANVFLPFTPPSTLGGLTTPAEVTEWLRSTGALSIVRDEANWVLSAGLDHAVALAPDSGTDIAMLINVDALAAATSVEYVAGGRTGWLVTLDDSFLFNRLPSHYVTLIGRIVLDAGGNTLSLPVWTWGGSYVFSGIPVPKFTQHYYGAVITSLSP